MGRQKKRRERGARKKKGVRVAVEAAATAPEGALPRLFEAPPITR